MSPTERERYKKQLKQEAAEQHKIKKDAWQAYKANHIVYLGHGIYWSDDTSEDKWDATDGAKRLLENQLPTFKNVKALAEQLNLTISQLKGLCFHREVATAFLIAILPLSNAAAASGRFGHLCHGLNMPNVGF